MLRPQPRPRILYLVPDLFGPPGGIMRYCRMVCLALHEAGHPLHVISLMDRPLAGRQAKSALPGVRYVPCSGSRALFVHRALRAMAGRPDVIVVGHPNLAPLGWLLARLLRARLVGFIYGIDAWEPLSPLRALSLRACDQILSISRFTARRAAEVNAVPSHKVRILFNCLDPSLQPAGACPIATPRASTCEELGAKNSGGASDAKLSLLTVARLSTVERYKGHDVVIRALPELLAMFPGLVYDVVGDGEGRAALEALAREQGVSDAVRFHGVVSDVELARYYGQADVFVMPSRLEGFGFVFLEAMAHARPVIAGNADASPEVVRDGESGFTIDPTSSSAFAQAAAKLLGDRALRLNMGARGAEIVAQEFGFDQFRHTLLKYLLQDGEHEAASDFDGAQGAFR